MPYNCTVAYVSTIMNFKNSIRIQLWLDCTNENVKRQLSETDTIKLHIQPWTSNELAYDIMVIIT